MIPLCPSCKINTQVSLSVYCFVLFFYSIQGSVGLWWQEMGHERTCLLCFFFSLCFLLLLLVYWCLNIYIIFIERVWGIWGRKRDACVTRPSLSFSILFFETASCQDVNKMLGCHFGSPSWPYCPRTHPLHVHRDSQCWSSHSQCRIRVLCRCRGSECRSQAWSSVIHLLDHLPSPIH